MNGIWIGSSDVQVHRLWSIALRMSCTSHTLFLIISFGNSCAPMYGSCSDDLEWNTRSLLQHLLPRGIGANNCGIFFCKMSSTDNELEDTFTETQ